MRACVTLSATIDPRCASPVSPPGNPGNTSRGPRPTDDRLCRRDHASNTRNGHFLTDFEAEPAEYCGEHENSYTLEHVSTPYR